MPARYRVALHGFSEFERTTLTFCFRHAAQRMPGYAQVERVADSDFIVADASHEAIAGSVTRGIRMRDTLFVGDKPPTGATACIPRPLDPERILRALDRMVALRATSGTPSEAPDVVLPLDAPDLRFPLLDTSEIVDTTPAAFQHEPVEIRFTDLEALAAAERAAPVPPAAGKASTARPASASASASASAPSQPASAAPPTVDVGVPARPTRPRKPSAMTEAERSEAKAAARRASRQARQKQAPSAAADAPNDVLLLDPSAGPVALGLVLESFGFTVHRAETIAAAREVLERTPLAAAFLDAAVRDGDADFDGLDLCLDVKRQLIPLAGAVPAVMLMSGQDAAAERVRAKLARCDALLTRPVRRGDAARALEDCNVALPADARRARRP